MGSLPVINMLKFAILVCAAAAVSAEAYADAALLYGGYGYGLGAYGHLGYAGYPYAYGAYAHPYAYGGYAHAGRYIANSGGVVHIAKREAEADADAYYGYYGHHYAPYAYGYAHRAYGYAGYL